MSPFVKVSIVPMIPSQSLSDHEIRPSQYERQLVMRAGEAGLGPPDGELPLPDPEGLPEDDAALWRAALERCGSDGAGYQS